MGYTRVILMPTHRQVKDELNKLLSIIDNRLYEIENIKEMFYLYNESDDISLEIKISKDKL